ncbi:lamin-like protein [Durio zibethinus]|uniref:Lamin-like protein n=1 Tax=Durio zibethinus TaxID=66656 RepID=A0A6P5YKU1_DURZI|nr:lamin-like protein [Durio zibethinus]
MERSKAMMVVVAAMAFALVMVVPRADATRFIVGANMGWTTNVNYTIWAQGKHFYNGDWLFFVYDRNQMNVLEVNKTDYESCNSDHPLHNWTTGAGRDVVPLNVTRHYYFISGKGFCFGGMKLAVLVENPPPPPTSSPLNEKSGSPSSIYRGQIVLPAVFAIGALWDAFVRVW